MSEATRDIVVAVRVGFGVCFLASIAIGCGGGSGGQGGAGGLSGHDGGTSCGSIERPSSNRLPDVLLLQDASGSMNNDINDLSCATGGCGPTSKWSLMTAAIKQVVTETETQVNWGLKFFP